MTKAAARDGGFDIAIAHREHGHALRRLGPALTAKRGVQASLQVR